MIILAVFANPYVTLEANEIKDNKKYNNKTKLHRNAITLTKNNT